MSANMQRRCLQTSALHVCKHAEKMLDSTHSHFRRIMGRGKCGFLQSKYNVTLRGKMKKGGILREEEGVGSSEERSQGL